MKLASGMTFTASALIAGLLLLSPGTLHAGDRPSPDERTRIEAALKSLGFTTWGEIEKEDEGRAWEIEDARGADGREYEIKLSVRDLREISRKRDD